MEIKIIACLNDNYSYLVFDKNKKNACVIDPSESEPIIEMIEKNLIMESDLEPHRRAYAKSLRETYSGDTADIMLLELLTQHEKVKEVT